jgi:hypothetical protein
VKRKIATSLLVIFTIALVGWTYATYEVYLYNDCVQMDHFGDEMAGFCHAYVLYQPRIIFWRSIAIEALAIFAYLLFRKLACSPKS